MLMRYLLMGAAIVTTLSIADAAQAITYDLVIDETPVNISGRERTAMTVNGQIPGPTLRFKEGEEVTLNVTNHMDVNTSIHWHGLIIPFRMDGVPGISFDGIKPGETFTYRYTVKQSGTFWYHSHSGLQEQAGIYGPIIIESATREPYTYDREYVVMLSDWSDEKPETILSNLKKQSDYYNYRQNTVFSFFKDVKKKGWDATVQDRKDWGNMRMLPTDITDVSNYTLLMNGQNPAQNWTGLFKPGERVRLRFINGAAMTYFDVRVPGLKMTVVQADGNNVIPVPVDEFRIAVAETYDVIVQPSEDRAYTIFAETMARNGYARGTLAPREGMTAEVPELREPPVLTMADMAPGMHEGMDHGSMSPGAMAGMDHSKMNQSSMGEAPVDHSTMDHSKMPQSSMSEAPVDHSTMDHSQMMAETESEQTVFYAPNSGLTPSAANGGKFLSYSDLKAMKPYAGYRAPDREIVMRLTGNMERYFWSINDKKYSEAEPVRLKYGERVRIKFINETMMTHPMHLHGMWMQLENGQGEFRPLKHVVSVAPGTTLNVDVPVVDLESIGEWAFHCHLMYHMATGMFRKFIVEDIPKNTSLEQPSYALGMK